MTSTSQPGAKTRIGPAGLAFLAVTSIGWGFNWPVTKYLIGYLPPLTLRGTTGVIGSILLAILALAWRQTLRVPVALWPRLVVAAILNVGCWMVLMGFALMYLPASEATVEFLRILPDPSQIMHSGMGYKEPVGTRPSASNLRRRGRALPFR